MVGMMPTEGTEAPDFTLLDQHGKSHTLSSYRGQWVLIYFYPKDDTPGCTTEACEMRDNIMNFEASNLQVLGVSVDSVASHKKFSSKYDLPFPILADTEKEVVRAYGVWGLRQFMGNAYEGTARTSFLVDPGGKISKVYAAVKPAKHATEVLGDVPKS